MKKKYEDTEGKIVELDDDEFAKRPFNAKLKLVGVVEEKKKRTYKKQENTEGDE